MQFLHLIALLAVVVLTTSTIGADASIMKAMTGGNAGGGRDKLIGKLRRMRPNTLVTFAESAIERMYETPNGKALHGRVHESAMSCASCESYVSMIMTIAGNEQLLNATEAVLKAECGNLFANDTTKVVECELAVDVVGFALPLLLKGLDSLKWDVPFNLCAILFDNVCTQDCCTSDYAPEQVYISLADSNDFSQMRVTWVTLKQGNNANVQFSSANGTLQVAAAQTARTYTFAGWIGTVNTAVMTGLTPDTTYSYTVGSDNNRSQTFTFKTFPTNIGTLQRPLRVVNIADMAYDTNSDWTVKRVSDRVRAGEVDMIIHNGDISYADGFMMHWDMFMRKVSPAFAAYVPYMTTPGNHEIYANFTSYKTRLAKSMPRDDATLDGAMYYALNVGPLRVLMMDSESFIDTADIPESEVAWAQQQLSSQDRKAQPWSLVVHHRPLYCNLYKNFNCKEFGYLLRLQAEGTYLKNKVDMVLAGHMHYYIRSYPMAMGAVTGTSYDNPTAPVHVVNGAAGNREGLRDAGSPDEMWAATSSTVGYGVMEIYADAESGKNALTYNFYESATDRLIDTFTINKSG